LENVQQRSELEVKFVELCSQVVQDLDLEIYDLEYLSSQFILRVYVQDPKTKSAVIEDCIKLDHALTEHIEDLEWMPKELTLEVSSPGMFRDLRCKDHFEAVAGEMVDLILFKDFDSIVECEDLPRRLKKQKKIRIKVIETMDNGIVVSEDDQKFEIDFKLIKKAKLSPPWN